MFNRRKLLIALCILACVLLAGGFVGTNLLGWWSMPLLGTLYTEGWWTLLLILPSLTMFALDGYSRPALALLSAGLLLFANTHGMIMGSVLDAAVPALFGKRRFALITLGMFAAGLAAGTLLGPVRGPHLPGHDHYGWAIWLVCFLAGMIGGALWEHWRPRGGTE